jgi:hypothetical protein
MINYKYVETVLKFHIEMLNIFLILMYSAIRKAWIYMIEGFYSVVESLAHVFLLGSPLANAIMLANRPGVQHQLTRHHKPPQIKTSQTLNKYTIQTIKIPDRKHI